LSATSKARRVQTRLSSQPAGNVIDVQGRNSHPAAKALRSRAPNLT
jgi:hypothetical protein